MNTAAVPGPAPSAARLPWALGLAGLLVNADSRAIAPIIPAIAAALHTKPSLAALLVSAYSVPYGLFQLVYGPLADGIGKVRTICAALCLFALGTFGCGLVGTFSALFVLRVVTGMFAAGIIPTTLAYIGDRFARADRPRAIAFFMSLSTTGQAMGLVIGGLSAEFVSYKVLFWLLGAAGVPVAAALLREVRRERRVAGAGAQEVLPVRPEASASSPLVSRYKALLFSRRTLVVYFLVFFEGLVFYGGFTYLGVYGVASLHLSYLAMGLLTALYSAGAFLGSRTITRALGRIGTLRMPLAGATAMAGGFALVFAVHHVAALAAGFVVLGWGYSYCHSTLQTLATELLPGGRATALSVFAFSLFLGSGLGPALFGGLLDMGFLRALFAVAAAGMLVLGAISRLLLAPYADASASAPPPSASGSGEVSAVR